MTEETRPSVSIETDEWRLNCFLDWVPKKISVTCPSCNGKGQVGGGFGDLDGPRECSKCFGSGNIYKDPAYSSKPALPPALVEHMRRAWWDFFNK